MIHKFSRVVIIHEYGEPSHYSGLISLCKSHDVKYEFRSFNILKRLYLFMRKKREDCISSIISDLFWFMGVWLNPGSLKSTLCVVGMAPFDSSILPMLRILKCCQCIYHTSWLYWDGANIPKKSHIFGRFIKDKWSVFLERVNALAVVTPDVKDNINHHYPSTVDKTYVVFHSFSQDIFFSDKSSSIKPLKITFLGRLELYKGIATIADLAEELPELKFKIIGNGQLSEYLIERSKKIDNLSLLGFVSDKNKIAAELRNSDVIILPSKKVPGWEELFGMALIEAMACGCVPLAVDHKGPKTILASTVLSEYLLPENAFFEKAKDKLIWLNENQVELDKNKEMSQELATKYSTKSVAILWEDIISKRVI